MSSSKKSKKGHNIVEGLHPVHHGVAPVEFHLGPVVKLVNCFFLLVSLVATYSNWLLSFATFIGELSLSYFHTFSSSNSNKLSKLWQQYLTLVRSVLIIRQRFGSWVR
jgi:hypothetical protein